MKTPPLILTAAVSLLAALPAFGAESAKAASKVEVLFAKAPDKYVDVRDGFSASEKGQAANLDSLKQYIEERGNELVADGQKLTVTLTEVDLAGDFEPWRDPAMNDVRIVKDIYPPRIDLEFKLTGADGKVIKEGKRELRDLAFMMKLSIHRDDPFRHEKQLLNEWLTRELKSAK
ncbi:MAG: DUF3016 domain-containing protein [Opitutaceae bacterium]|nr:DUF3016 domain-containing protein [Opitutaceae bacterium]